MGVIITTKYYLESKEICGLHHFRNGKRSADCIIFGIEKRSADCSIFGIEKRSADCAFSGIEKRSADCSIFPS